jgi:hypothetical protein
MPACGARKEVAFGSSGNRLLTLLRKAWTMQINMPLWWSFVILFALAFGLAACDSPSPRYMGQTARQVTIDGSVFSVRATPWDAEAIRVNMELNTRRKGIVALGGVAIETATGCKVKGRTLQGDTNIVRAKIACPGVAPLRKNAPNLRQLDCGLVSGWRKDSYGRDFAEVDCETAG